MSVPPVKLPRIRGTQIGLKNPAQVDAIKADMRAGRFQYLEQRARVGGIQDQNLVFHVVEGHHRMVAALEIYHETGEMMPLLQLLAWGKWTDRPQRPSRKSSYALATRVGCLQKLARMVSGATA